MNLRPPSASPICAAGSRRTALSPTWSGPEGSSHNELVPGRRLPPFFFAWEFEPPLPPCRAVGVLTPLLALFVIIDVSGCWLFTWSLRGLLQVRWRVVFVGLAVAMIYY